MSTTAHQSYTVELFATKQTERKKQAKYKFSAILNVFRYLYAFSISKSCSSGSLSTVNFVHVLDKQKTSPFIALKQFSLFKRVTV